MDIFLLILGIAVVIIGCGITVISGMILFDTPSYVYIKMSSVDAFLALMVVVGIGIVVFGFWIIPSKYLAHRSGSPLPISIHIEVGK